jgi:ribonuclease BN (tRNA processing enzyme)
MCAAVEIDNHLFILDAGTGMRRFQGRIGSALLRKHDKISIFLSHYHLDHIVGISYLPLYLAGKHLVLYCPEPDSEGRSPEEILGRLFDSPIFFPLSGFPCSIEIRHLSEGEHRIEGVRMGVFRQSHTGRSVGYRIEDYFYYATDRLATGELVQHARGVHYLFHDASFDEDDFKTIKDPEERSKALYGHSTAQDAARQARDAKVRYLGLIHVHPSMTETDYRALAEKARQIFPSTFLPKDGRWIYLD